MAPRRSRRRPGAEPGWLQYINSCRSDRRTRSDGCISRKHASTLGRATGADNRTDCRADQRGDARAGNWANR